MSQPLEVRLIPVASIRSSPYQYRTRFDDPKQQELIESMRASGQSTPILVRPRAKTEGQAETENGYELVSGERRWRAAKELGWESIRAICEEMTDAEAAARVVTENEVRADTNVMEKAAGYKRLTQPPCNFNYEEIAKRFGFASGTPVRRIIDLLDQPEAIQRYLSQDRLGEAHVRFLSRIKDLNARLKLAKRAKKRATLWSRFKYRNKRQPGSRPLKSESADSAVARPLTLTPARSVQLCVFSLGLLQNGDVRVGVLPEGEEVLIRLAALGQIASERIGTGEPELCERVQYRPERSSAPVIQNLLEIRCSLPSCPCAQVRFAANIE